MTEDNINNSNKVCNYLKVFGNSLLNCFPICGSCSVLSEQDKLNHLEKEWKDIYDRVNKLEREEVVNINGVTKNIIHRDRATNEKEEYIQKVVTDEVKQLFSRVDFIEKKLDTIIKNNDDNKISNWYSINNRNVESPENNQSEDDSFHSDNTDNSDLSSIVEVEMIDVIEPETEANSKNEPNPRTEAKTKTETTISKII